MGLLCFHREGFPSRISWESISCPKSECGGLGSMLIQMCGNPASLQSNSPGVSPAFALFVNCPGCPSVLCGPGGGGEPTRGACWATSSLQGWESSGCRLCGLEMGHGRKGGVEGARAGGDCGPSADN